MDLRGQFTVRGSRFEVMRGIGGDCMSEALREIEETDLVNLERLAHLLRSLSPVELETLEMLLDEEASKTIEQSLKQLQEGKGIPIEDW